MHRYIYFRKNGGMRFWRCMDVGGSVYISAPPAEAKNKMDAALIGLAATNILLLLVIAAQRIASYY